MRKLTLFIPAPPLWLILVCNIAALLLVIAGLIFIIYVKKRPFCIPPSSRDLDEADKFQPKRGAVGKVISKQSGSSVKNGFSFKDHGDDIGTDMSEEKGPNTKPEFQSDELGPFDPSKVARVIAFEEKFDQKRAFGEDFNLYGDAKRISDTPQEKTNPHQAEPDDRTQKGNQ
ncbi:hypothetical protein Y032_1134g3667 [Ancylostoma ceylanicum]|nr:hypothetical protein Y032_1134g3667 [Ancylostoma ceylanicum]